MNNISDRDRMEERDRCVRIVRHLAHKIGKEIADMERAGQSTRHLNCARSRLFAASEKLKRLV